MKKLLSVLVTTSLLSSCVETHKVVINDEVSTIDVIYKSDSPKKCEYKIDLSRNGRIQYLSFIDSCGKFSVGDTIKFTK